MAWIILIVASLTAQASFQSSVDYAVQHPEIYDHQTAYCHCEIVGEIINIKACGYMVQKVQQRAMKLEFVQIVPSETFGKTFPEWSGKSAKCLPQKLTGLECARTNSKFVKMESDLYNIFPESAEINELRGTIPIGVSSVNKVDYGCGIKISDQFEPAEPAKGTIARAILNFAHRYPEHVKFSRKQVRLYKNWAKVAHLADPECRRMSALEKIVGYKNLYASKCTIAGKAKNSSSH